jgi:hypothetical protein
MVQLTKAHTFYYKTNLASPILSHKHIKSGEEADLDIINEKLTDARASAKRYDSYIKLSMKDEPPESLEFWEKNDVAEKEVEENATTGFIVLMEGFADSFKGFLELRSWFNVFVNHKILPVPTGSIDSSDCLNP